MSSTSSSDEEDERGDLTVNGEVIKRDGFGPKEKGINHDDSSAKEKCIESYDSSTKENNFKSDDFKEEGRTDEAFSSRNSSEKANKSHYFSTSSSKDKICEQLANNIQPEKAEKQNASNTKPLAWRDPNFKYERSTTNKATTHPKTTSPEIWRSKNERYDRTNSCSGVDDYSRKENNDRWRESRFRYNSVDESRTSAYFRNESTNNDGRFKRDRLSSSLTNNEITPILPSKIFDKKYIYYPEKYETEMPKNINAGKWLLYEKYLKKMNDRWLILKDLCDEGIFIAIKSSTAGNYEDFKIGIIMCYTSNAENEQEVKKAADAIRKQISYERPMYYKTNDASIDGQYTHHGDKDICLYKHCENGYLYKKDESNQWLKVLD